MKENILFALWFFLPAGIANVAPIFAAKWRLLESLNKPLDFGQTFRGKRILGDNKTIRGLIVGIIIGSTAGLLFQNSLLFGFLLSIGALGGDAFKSFVKRQVGIPSGKTWFPFDQLDYIIGALLLSTLHVQLTAAQYIAVIIVWFTIHIIASITGYLFRYKSSP